MAFFGKHQSDAVQGSARRRSPRPVACCVVMLAVWAWFGGSSPAGFMQFSVEQIHPRMGQRGKSVDVVMRGICLREPVEIVFYGPGIRARDFRTLPDLEKPLSRPHVPPDVLKEQFACTLDIAPDCPIGEHVFRVRTRTGITNLATFHVTPFPTVAEGEATPSANDTPATATAVTPNVTVLGSFASKKKNRLDVDVYRVPMTAGEHLSVEVEAARIADDHFGSTMFDTRVRIPDERGTVLADNDDGPTHAQDPLASVLAPGDGPLYVEVRRSLLAYGNEWETWYCLHVGRNRQPTAVYPAGGRAGSSMEVTMLGDPAGPYQSKVNVPDRAGTFALETERPTVSSLRASPYDNVLEDPGQRETAVPSLPAALNGILSSDGELDRFRVTVKKGDRYRVRVYARALGFPLDPRLRIFKAPAGGDAATQAAAVKDEILADDATLPERDIFHRGGAGGSGGMPDCLDPSVIWQPGETGSYIVEVGNTTRKGSPTSVFRVEIEPARDAIHTLLRPTAFDNAECVRTSGMAVPRGNRRTVSLSLVEGLGNTFKGPVALVVNGLPRGVRAVVPDVQKDQTVVPIQFQAAEDAPLGSALITVDVEARDGSHPLETGSHQWVPFLNQSGGNAWKVVHVDRYVLAVTDPVPLTVDIEPPPVPLVQGGELVIPLKVRRNGGFAEPIEVQCDWLPKGLERPPEQVIPAGVSDAEVRIAAVGDAPLGTWPLALTASYIRDAGGDKYLGSGQVNISTAFVDLVVAEPFVVLTAQPESIRRGEKKQFRWAVQHKRPIDGQAEVRLLGLPKGVMAREPHPRIDGTAREIAFDIEATDEALLGPVGDITCELVMRASGREIRQRSGKGILRIDPAIATGSRP